MVNSDKNFCDIYEQWKMNQVAQQQKEYYDSLEKKSKSEKSEVDLLAEMFEELNSIAEEEIEKAFEKGLNDYYNDLLKQKTPTKSMSDLNEGYLWEEDKKQTKQYPNIYEKMWAEKEKQEQTTTYDGKSTPSYYMGKHKQITAADVVADFGLGYNVGNSVCYLLRAGKKPDNAYIQDLKKAVHHLNMEIEQHERK